MPDMQYLEPSSLEETYDTLQRFGDEARLLAGGTGLINLIKQRLVQPSCLIGLRRLPNLDRIGLENGAIRIGALVPHQEVETSALIREHAPLLAETYKRVATVRIRNVATVGGGLAHADPNQDPPATFIVLGARVQLSSRGGTRELPLEEFFTDYYETALAPGEVVTGVIVPVQPAGSGAAYVKFLPRTADDYATVSVAALVTLSDDGKTCQDARIALGSVGNTPIRATAGENLLRNQQPTSEALRAAAATVASAVDPITDFRGSSDYKRDMAVVWVRRTLERAFAQAGGGAR